MRREVQLEDISDGKLYTVEDMVKAGCADCMGCSACCHGMGNSLILDPYDIYLLTKGLGKSFMEMVNDKEIELNMADGVIIPNMSMSGKNEACHFLDDKGRCSVHDIRPGICRLFPLGRYYTEGSFKYILQTGECKKENRTKVKIKKFLGIDNLKAYESYITDWHYYLKAVEKDIRDKLSSNDDNKAREISVTLLNTYFIMPWDFSKSFYEQYYERRKISHE